MLANAYVIASSMLIAAPSAAECALTLLAEGGRDDIPGLVHRGQNEVGVRAEGRRTLSLSAAGCRSCASEGGIRRTVQDTGYLGSSLGKGARTER